MRRRKVAWSLSAILMVFLAMSSVRRDNILSAAPAIAQASKDKAKPLARSPELIRASLYGLEAGKTTQLVIYGTDLLPNPQLLGLPANTHSLRPGGTADRLEFDVSIPARTAVGHYPLRVRTLRGITAALPMAVEGLPQVADGTSDPQHPLALPVAISGEVPSGKPAQVFVSALKGQRIVVDVECQRLGGTLSPVLELKNSRRTPVAIQWSQAELQGDARIVADIPADGVYSVELHDLAFKVSGSNPFRLKIGELKLADGVFPAVLPTGTRREVKLIGPGWASGMPLTADAGDLLPGMTRSVVIPAEPGVAAPAPVITGGEGIEVFERGSSDSPQNVDCQFAETPRLAVSINGRIDQPGEIDKYLLQVRPEQKLRMQIDGRGAHSRLDCQISVSRTDGTVVAQTEERPQLMFAVPTGVTSLLVTVRDLHGLGGNDFPYRLEIAPGEQPGFTLALREERVLIPRDGLATVRLDVNRQGYAGAIAITAEGAPHLEVRPAEIPAEAVSVLLQLKVRTGSPDVPLQSLRITGESRDMATPLRRVATLQTGSRLSLVTNSRYELPVAVLPATGFDISVKTPPTQWYRGIPAEIPLSVDTAKLPTGIQAFVLTLVSTEPPRNRTLNPIRGTFPFVKSTGTKPLPVRTKVSDREQPVTTAVVQLQVPEDGTDREFDCAIRADLLSNAGDLRPLATTFTRSFHVKVSAAATIKYAANALVLVSGSPVKFTGEVHRHPDYKETIEASLTGLAADYLAPKVTIPPDQDHFEIIVTAPKVTAGGEILNINFVLKDRQGRRLQPDLLLPARIVVQK